MLERRGLHRLGRARRAHAQHVESARLQKRLARTFRVCSTRLASSEEAAGADGMKISRRGFVKYLAVAAGALRMAARGGAAAPGALQTMTGQSYDVAVIGAGVFGAWTAYHLKRGGKKVALLDAYGPANSRASSGG